MIQERVGGPLGVIFRPPARAVGKWAPRHSAASADHTVELGFQFGRVPIPCDILRNNSRRFAPHRKTPDHHGDLPHTTGLVHVLRETVDPLG